MEVKNIPLIHYSTNYVYDGCKKKPYLEKDIANPINVYGTTKLNGDNEIVPKVDVIISTWSITPQYSIDPFPFFPTNPVACESSTCTNALYIFAKSQIDLRSAI